MALLIILGVVVFLAVLVIGFLFYMLSKESKDSSTQKVVLITNFNDIKHSPDMPKMTGNTGEFVQLPTVSPAGALSGDESKVKEEFSLEKYFKDDAHEKRVVELEKELSEISQKAQAQSQEALTTIEELRKENEELKTERSNRVTSAEANMIKAQETITTLNEEQANLQSRLTQSQEQVLKLQEEAVYIKQQMAQEVMRSKSENDKLEAENQTLQRSLDAAIADSSKQFRDQVETVTQENQMLKNANNDLILTNQKLKELNDGLIEKSESLQWELTKARAQMTSFERACENYQNQLKDSFERGGTVEQDYSKLNETNNRLKSVLENLQKENEEFSKREKLFEFELEKSKNQIVTLEREYQYLKTTVGQQSDPIQEGQ